MKNELLAELKRYESMDENLLALDSHELPLIIIINRVLVNYTNEGFLDKFDPTADMRTKMIQTIEFLENLPE